MISTQWYLCRLARASQTSGFSSHQKRGFVPSFWEFISHIPGLITGNVPVHATGLTLTAISLDHGLTTPIQRKAIFDALEAAPDARVFDIRESIGNGNGAWIRKSGLLATLENGLIDTGGRMQTGGKTIRYLFQELARTLLFYQSLGPAFYPLPLDSKLDEIAKPGRDSLADVLVERGFPSAKVPNPNVSFRTFYRVAMNEPFADFGIESGGFHLGHRDANLKTGG